MSKEVRTWPYWTGALLLILLFLAFYYRDNRNYVCEGCYSRLARNQRRMGLWMGFSFPISSDSAEEKLSHFYDDFLAPNHSHVWIFAQGSPYGVFGWGGCALGAGSRGNSLAQDYEDPGFRAYVLLRIAKGDLGRDDFVAACLLPRYPSNAENASAEFQRLTKLGKKLEEEFLHR